MHGVARRMRDSVAGFRSREASSPGEQWQRVVLNRAVAARLDAERPASSSAAEISGTTHEDLGWQRYESLMYPEFDLCEPLTGQGTFGVVICEQVIEHVVDPVAAVANLRDLCEPGGLVIVSTPFLIKVHEIWGMHDYWRFTPRGLRTLMERAGLEVEEVGSWGNRGCLDSNLGGWTAYRPWHSLRNEPDIPLQVWAFARRPLDTVNV